MQLGSVARSLSAVTDYFVHPALRGDQDTHHRGRILIAVMLAFALLSLTAYAITLAAGVPPEYGRVICLPVAAAFLGLLVLTRLKEYFLFCGLSAVLTAQAAIVAGICVSGGPVASPAIQLLVVPPLMAYFFGGLRWGRLAVLLGFALVLGLYALHFGGVAFNQTIGSERQMDAASGIVNLLNVCLIAVMAFIYESTSVALRRERDTEHARYCHLAKTDPLTGLANRRNFDALLAERLASQAAQGLRGFALGYLDLDGFKPINDRYGHGVGDEVLCIIADRLRGALREEDFVGRHGGDEFLLFLDRVEDHALLEGMAQRVLAAINAPMETSVGPLRVSGSLGFALYPLDAVDIEALKKAADVAMYEAKREHGVWRRYRSGAAGAACNQSFVVAA